MYSWKFYVSTALHFWKIWECFNWNKLRILCFFFFFAIVWNRIIISNWSFSFEINPYNLIWSFSFKFMVRLIYLIVTCLTRIKCRVHNVFVPFSCGHKFIYSITHSNWSNIATTNYNLFNIHVTTTHNFWWINWVISSLDIRFAIYFWSKVGVNR